MLRLKFIVAGFTCAAFFGSCNTVQTPPPVVPSVVQVTAPPLTPAEPVNVLENSDFESGVSAPWMPVILDPAKAEAEVKDGAFCVDIAERGANDWDIQLAYRGLNIEDGHRYEVRAKVWSTADTSIRAKVGMSGPPYSEYWNQGLMIGNAPKWLEGSFVKTRGTDPSAEFAFHVGGSLARLKNLPFSVCVDEITLSDPQYVKPAKPAALPLSDVRVNQLGYLPGFRKIAAVRAVDTVPLPWSLTKNGKQLASGMTSVFGNDAASFDHLHRIDFSDFNEEGEGYLLNVGDKQSLPFAISRNLYKQPAADAVRYFYHHRVGVPIEMPYAGEERWVRPAGHVQDASVPCLAGTDCTYSLDVSGGWYDAGDHGKYVVNAGYAVWALLNLYERAVFLAKPTPFSDNTLNIPESGNGLSDLLDEARFEIEFMLKMEVPSGEKLAGMVHHKIHDEDWTPIPTAPDKDPMRRFLHAPSTAATLNLSAAAAQAARIWKDIDPAFSRKCLEAAERTYLAATKHPDRLAGPEDRKGGGAYEDSRVSDEFFWAAAELYITTGNKKYASVIQKSPYFGTLPTLDDVPRIGIQRTAMSWQSVEGLGTVSLVTVPNKLKEADKNKLKAKIKAAADLTVKVIAEEGYGQALTSKPEADYYWGSNFVIMNNLIILALAYDFSKEDGYRNALAEGMDYLFGRNPNDQSYITGLGSRPLQNPHHRFFAFQANPTFPSPPPGFISGGPNQHRQDPRILASVPKSAAPAAQFVDHIDSYSTNEVAINWNAAFAWLTAYMNESAQTQEIKP